MSCLPQEEQRRESGQYLREVFSSCGDCLETLKERSRVTLLTGMTPIIDSCHLVRIEPLSTMLMAAFYLWFACLFIYLFIFLFAQVVIACIISLELTGCGQRLINTQTDTLLRGFHSRVSHFKWVQTSSVLFGAKASPKWTRMGWSLDEDCNLKDAKLLGHSFLLPWAGYVTMGPRSPCVPCQPMQSTSVTTGDLSFLLPSRQCPLNATMTILLSISCLWNWAEAKAWLHL